MKKFLNIITAAAMAICTPIAMNANAIYQEVDPSLIAEKYPGYELLYSREASDKTSAWGFAHDVYMNPNAGTLTFLRVDHYDAYMNIFVYDKPDEALFELLLSYCEGFCINTNSSTATIYSVNITEYPEVKDKAREIIEAAEKEANIYTARMGSERSTASLGYWYGYLSGVDPTYFMSITKEQAEGIDAYMQATGYNYTVTTKEAPYDVDYKYYNINFDEGEITEEEEFQLALDIANKFQIELPIVYQLSNNELTPQTEVDILNSVEGDANNDGAVGISDVTYIMQSISDSDNYALDAQQTFNADVTGGNDGITAEDALVIQKYLAGQTDTLG